MFKVLMRLSHLILFFDQKKCICVPFGIHVLKSSKEVEIIEVKGICDGNINRGQNVKGKFKIVRRNI